MIKKLIKWSPVVVLVMSILACGGYAGTQVVPTASQTSESECPSCVCPTCASIEETTQEPVLSESPTPKKPTKTPTKIKKSATPTKTRTPTPAMSSMPYQIQSPLFDMGNVLYPEKGCNWVGVMGQVFGLDGKPQKEIVVDIQGVLNGAPVEWMGLTGLANGYAPDNAYEIQIGNATFDSTNQLIISLFDNQFNPLSDPYLFSTKSGCDSNMIIINFKQVK